MIRIKITPSLRLKKLMSKEAVKEAEMKESELKMLYHKADRVKLLEDILSIKRDVDFKPVYKVSPMVKTVCERPAEFQGGFADWYQAMRDDHRKTIHEKIIKKKEKEDFSLVLKEKFMPLIMNRMMHLD